MEVPTVTVKHPSGKGSMIINKEDYKADPNAYELVEAEEAKEADTPIAPKAPEKSDDSKTEGSDEKSLEGMNRAELVERLEKADGDLANVEGTGKNGAVKNTDIVKAIQEAEAKKDE